jgi:hypothetical protein
VVVAVLVVKVVITCPVPCGSVHAPAKAAEGAHRSPIAKPTQRFSTLHPTPYSALP